MGPSELVVSGLLSLIVYSIVLLAVYKIFQIRNDVTEMKELLQTIKRNTEEIPTASKTAAAEAAPQSAETLVRAVHENWQVADK